MTIEDHRAERGERRKHHHCPWCHAATPLHRAGCPDEPEIATRPVAIDPQPKLWGTFRMRGWLALLKPDIARLTKTGL